MKYIVIFFIVGFALFLVLGSKTDKNAPVVVTENSIEQKICYLYSQKNANGLIDSSWLEMTIKGSDVNGQFNDLPAEKDSKKGFFKGTIVNNNNSEVQAYWDAQAEGMTVKEELFIIFNSTQAQVAYGEMTKNDDGSYSYADKSKLTYGRAMEKIDCNLLFEKNNVESYIRQNAKIIITDSTVLGGSWYITSVNVDANTNIAEIEYEDGHIAGKGNIMYQYENGQIKSVNFTKK